MFQVEERNLLQEPDHPTGRGTIAPQKEAVFRVRKSPWAGQGSLEPTHGLLVGARGPPVTCPFLHNFFK